MRTVLLTSLQSCRNIECDGWCKRTVKALCQINSPEVKLVVEVPCGGVAHHLPPVVRALQHRVLPEVVRHRDESERREELLGQLHDSHCIVTLSKKHTCHGAFTPHERDMKDGFLGNRFVQDVVLEGVCTHLSDEFVRHINDSSIRVRKQQLLDGGPLLTPHVS